MEQKYKWNFYKRDLKTGKFLYVYIKKNPFNVTNIKFLYESTKLEEQIDKLFIRVKELNNEKSSIFCSNYVIGIIFETKRMIKNLETNVIKNKNRWKNLKKMEIILLNLKKHMSKSCSQNEDQNQKLKTNNELIFLYETIRRKINDIWEEFEDSLTV
jgi:uncharacterized protein (DUF342 family)